VKGRNPIFEKNRISFSGVQSFSFGHLVPKLFLEDIVFQINNFRKPDRFQKPVRFGTEIIFMKNYSNQILQDH